MQKICIHKKLVGKIFGEKNQKGIKEGKCCKKGGELVRIDKSG